MTQTPPAERRQTGDTLSQIAARTGFSEDAIGVMAQALRKGGGSMAQFDHPEFGGFGQGSAGGMLMIGDMFNDGLKTRVRGLLEALAGARDAGLLREGGGTGEERSGGMNAGTWWPEGLGRPASTGAQNGRRYAVFPDSRRLAIETEGKVTLYDTAGHRIGGVSQAQGATASLRLSSDRGDVDLDSLAVVKEAAEEPEPRTAEEAPSASSEPATAPIASSASPASPAPAPSPSPVIADTGADTKVHAGAKPARSEVGASGTGDPIATLRHLASLRDEGILTEAEFVAKKQELLGRL